MDERFHTFTVLISTINRAIYRIKTEEMAEFNLKSSHVSCLYYLHRNESLTVTELCDICEEDKANISRSIKHLETNGYIECTSNDAKRYHRPLALTQAGREIGERISQKVDAILKKASEGLSDRIRSDFYSALALIDSNLKKICDGYDVVADQR